MVSGFISVVVIVVLVGGTFVVELYSESLVSPAKETDVVMVVLVGQPVVS